MKFFLATTALVGSVLAVPHVPRAVPTSLSTLPTTYPATSTPSWSTASASSTPSCSVVSEGDNGNHYGWCKKAKHYGTYENGKTDGDDDDF